MDLVRKILLAVESDESGWAPAGDIEIEGYSDDHVGYHALLIIEAGLAHGHDVTQMGAASPRGDIGRLTWAGHEFIDATRDPSVWEKVKGTARQGGSVAFGVLLDVALTYAKTKSKELLGLPVG